MKKYKKPLLFVLLGLDIALTVFLFIISIIILVKLGVANGDPKVAAANSGPFIKYLFANSGFYLGLFVVPLFVLLAINIVCLVIYVRKTTKKEPAKLEDLTDEQKEALRQELLKDLQVENKKE